MGSLFAVRRPQADIDEHWTTNYELKAI